MNQKMIIEISGGMIQGIYCTDSSIDVEVFDYDNADDNGTNVESGNRQARLQKGMVEISWVQGEYADTDEIAVEDQDRSDEDDDDEDEEEDEEDGVEEKPAQTEGTITFRDLAQAKMTLFAAPVVMNAGDTLTVTNNGVVITTTTVAPDAKTTMSIGTAPKDVKVVDDHSRKTGT